MMCDSAYQKLPLASDFRAFALQLGSFVFVTYNWPANVISTKKYDVPYNCKFVLAQRCLMLSELSTKHLSSVYEKTMPFASRTPTNLTPEQRSVLTQIPADLSIERLLVRE